MLDEAVEDAAYGLDGERPLLSGRRAEVDPLEHEGAQIEHRAADLLALEDVTRPGRGLDDVVDQRVDPARAALAEERDLLPGKLVGAQDARAQRVVDVVVDVR